MDSRTALSEEERQLMEQIIPTSKKTGKRGD